MHSALNNNKNGKIVFKIVKKTLVFFLLFHFVQFYLFPYECRMPWFISTQNRAFIREKLKLHEME